MMWRVALATALLAVSFFASAADAPKAVRIATYGFVVAGNTTIRGTALVDRVIEEGWLEQELNKRGFKLEWVPIVGNTGAVTNESFASGRIDFANYGDLPSVLLNAGGMRTEVIVPSGRGTDMSLLVPVGSTAKSIADLKGKRISVHRGRPWELGLRKLIEANGLKYSDFRIFNLDPQAGAAALAAGKVDAHFVNGGDLLEDKGIGHIIWSTKGKPLHFKMRAELWGARDFVERNPELTQLVATAYVKASYWVAKEQNRDAVVAIGTLNGTPERVVRKSYEDPTLSWKDRWSPLVDDVVLEHYRDVVAAAREDKLISKSPNPDELVEPKFVNAAIKSLKLEGYWTPWKLTAR